MKIQVFWDVTLYSIFIEPSNTTMRVSSLSLLLLGQHVSVLIGPSSGP